jgi:hypothetical protein
VGLWNSFFLEGKSICLSIFVSNFILFNLGESASIIPFICLFWISRIYCSPVYDDCCISCPII